MSAAERRHEKRVEHALRFNPVGCVMICNGEKIPVEVINYHYRGACFKVGVGDYRLQTKGTYFNFKIGNKDISEKIVFRLIWETVAENGMFGVEFSSESSYVLARAERFLTHLVNTPVISSQDPLDPNRIIYFKAINISTTGMLVSTSLSNKHLFPGMELRTAVLDIPGIGKTDLDLFIENSRSSEGGNFILYGVSIKGSSHNYIELISKYLSNLGSTPNADERIEKLAEANLVHKTLSKHLTIREIRDQKGYEAVLKLRFIGYKLAGKVKAGVTWQDMGDGLEKEGVLIAAYLGGQLVASAEFRFLRQHGLKLSDKIDVMALPEIHHDNLSEINKLVVHPKAQNTDIVLGIFQKIHAIAMLNGRPDGLISAEDKLVSLYQRLGFHKIGYSYPHPTKDDTKLNLMIIRSEAYATSEGMNPYAWSMAFSEAHKFFSEIGIQKKSRLNLKQNAVKGLTYVAVNLFKKKKKNHVTEKAEPKSNIAHRNVADPKWTKQHLNASVLLPYILEAESLIGKDKVTKILLDCGLQSDYFRSVSNWVSIAFFDELIEQFSKFGDPYLLNKKAGYRSTSKEVLGSNYFLMKHFLSPGLAFKSFEKFLPKFNKTRIYRVINSTGSSCRIRITNPDPSLLPKHHSARENWIALIDAYILIITGKPGSIETVKSSFDGDSYCEYEVRWTNQLISFKNVAGFALVALGVWESFHFVLERVDATSVYTGAGIIFVATAFAFVLQKLASYRRKYLDMMESLASFEKDADERYRELQGSKSILEKSYQEGKVLENINREIQTSDDLTKILQTALESICIQFDFKRSFAMITDEDQKMLRTSAIFGGEASAQELWQFKVDISTKRENPLVLSSVFHTGQSILISNIEDHKFHLNEASRRLVEKLGTKGFAMVPIPSESKNWGVLIADKGQSGELITRRDLVALQRVAQSIGLALDKKAKIDSEIRVRKIFQKYVPSSVVESTLGMQEPKLGGENKDVICLFMDIRNFTQMASQVPPQILCEMLNKIFDMLQKTISPSNGMIDKFLGDGALVTWGAVPGSIPNPIFSIDAVKKFGEMLLEYNQELSARGLKPVEIGFGIHRGTVVAGNIGSNERMEFTVIGSAVNMASRLEQLTKIFKSQVVVSEALLPLTDLGPEWTIHREVQVRGIEGPITVASLQIQQIPLTLVESS